MAIAGLVLGGVSLVVGVLTVLLLILGSSVDEERFITEAGAGDCIDLANQTFDTVETYIPRACDEDHQLEVVGIVIAADGDFPGRDALDAVAEDRCGEQFAGYAGIELDESRFDLRHLRPSAESWDEGDREIMCMVQEGSGGTLSVSVRGRRR